MRAVNFLPRESRSGRGRVAGFSFDPLLAGAAAMTVVVAVMIGGGFVLGRSHASSQQQQLDAARAQLAAALARQTAANTGTPIVATPDVVSQIPTWKAAVGTALSTRVPYDLILAQFGRLVPARVTIASLTLGGASGAGAAGAGGELAIGGTAFANNDVAQLLARLALMPEVTGAQLTSSVTDRKTGVVTFAISAQLKGATTGFTTTGTGTPSTTTTPGSGA